MYNVTSSNWKWLSGNIKFGYLAAKYAVPGSYSLSNFPAGICGHSADFISGTNTLVVFGGRTSATVPVNGIISDLWYFDVNSTFWKFTVNANTVGNYTAPQFPGARYLSSMVAMPNSPMFYMVKFSNSRLIF